MSSTDELTFGSFCDGETLHEIYVPTSMTLSVTIFPTYGDEPALRIRRAEDGVQLGNPAPHGLRRTAWENRGQPQVVNVAVGGQGQGQYVILPLLSDGTCSTNLECPVPEAHFCTPSARCEPCEDRLEPNDLYAEGRLNYSAEAVPITLGDALTSVACGSDTDWYEVTIPADRRVAIRLQFLHEVGDVDMQLFESNPDEEDESNLTLLDASEGVTNGEELVVVEAPVERRLWLKVLIYGRGNYYRLEASEASPTQCTDASHCEGTCRLRRCDE